MVITHLSNYRTRTATEKRPQAGMSNDLALRETLTVGRIVTHSTQKTVRFRLKKQANPFEWDELAWYSDGSVFGANFGQAETESGVFL